MNFPRAQTSDFFYWINERHRICVKRALGEPKPWSTDPIFQKYKFTNAFRELDRGTVFLKQGLAKCESGIAKVFNVFVYRMINNWETFEECGFTDVNGVTWQDLKAALNDRWDSGRKVFTSAHMTVGYPGEPKVLTTTNTLDEVMSDIMAAFTKPVDWIKALESGKMQDVFEALMARRYYGIGKFIAYEILCDLRFLPHLWRKNAIVQHTLEPGPSDVLTWASIGPGAKRGLERLGMPDSGKDGLKSMQELYAVAPEYLEPHVMEHYQTGKYPYFELREIEHSLCEFDKLQRVKTGAGKPRQRYDGQA